VGTSVEALMAFLHYSGLKMARIKSNVFVLESPVSC